MLIPLELPASKDRLLFNLYDWDATGDDLVASMRFSIKDILKTTDNTGLLEGEPKKYEMRWVNLYGCNPEYSGKHAEEQNKYPLEATTFKGRVLVEYWCIDDEHPVMKVRDIEENNEY